MRRAEREPDLPVLKCPADLWLPAAGEHAVAWSKRWRAFWEAVDYGRGCIIVAPDGVEVARGDHVDCLLWVISRAAGIRSNWYRDNYPAAHSSNRSARWVDVGGAR